MDNPILISIIGAGASVLVALISISNTILLQKAGRTIKDLEKNTNSIKDALVLTTATAEFARGLKTGQEEVRTMFPPPRNSVK